MEELNHALFLLINAPEHPGALTLVIARLFAEYAIWVIPAIVGIGWLRGDERTRRILLEATASGLAGLLINQLIALFWQHPRPFMIGLGHTYLSHAADSSFPSDHLTLLWAVGFSFLMHRSPRMAGIMLSLLGLPVAWARIYLGVHFPLDMIGAALVAGFAMLGRTWELGWGGALVLGAAMAMSSTAIIVKLMAERLELESPHGRLVMGVLLFQDLAVVPLLVLIPALNSSAGEMARALALAGLKAAVLLGVLLWGGQKVMRWWLTLVARRKSEELFMLNLLLVTLGLAWLTEHAGLSLALGAFVADMLIAETEYKHQVETDIRPFHDVLLGLFFITIGMKLDWHPLVESWWLVILLTALPVVAKSILIAGLARLFKSPPGTALRTGLYLAQAGEFGFVLLTLGAQERLIAEQWVSPVLASMVLSMLSAPLLVMLSTVVLSLVFGVGLARLLVSPHKRVRWLAQGFIELTRNTPTSRRRSRPITSASSQRPGSKRCGSGHQRGSRWVTHWLISTIAPAGSG